MFFSARRRLASRVSTPSAHGRRSARKPVRLALETLEDRCVPALITWTTALEGDFGDAANWTVSGTGEHRVPGPDDDAIIHVSPIHTVTMSGSHTVGSLQVSSSTATFRINGGALRLLNTSFIWRLDMTSGGALEVAGGMTTVLLGTSMGRFTVLAGATLTFGRNPGQFVHLDAPARLTGPGVIAALRLVVNTSTDMMNLQMPPGSVLQVDGTLTVLDTLTWMGVTMQGAGTTVIAQGATLTMSGTAGNQLSNQHTLANAGTVVWTGTGNFVAMDTSQITNSGNWQIRNNATLQNFHGTARFINERGGTLAKTGLESRGTTAFGLILDNALGATVRADDGVLDLSGGGTSNGTFTATNGTLRFTGGTQTLNLGAEFTGNGFTRVAGGTLEVNASHVPANRFALDSGTVSGTGLLRLTGLNSEWNGGTMAGSGTVAVSPEGSLIIGGAANKRLQDQRTLANYGQVVWTGTGNIQVYGTARFRNFGDWQIRNNQSLVNVDGTAKFSNESSGTLIKTGPNSAGTTAFGLILDNSRDATVRVDSGGVLDLSGGGNSSGTFDVANGTLRFTGGTQTLGNGTRFTGNGFTRVAGGTLVVNGSNVPATRFALDSGTLSGWGTLVLTGASEWNGGIMTGLGTTRVSFGGSLVIGGADDKRIQDLRYLDNFGTVTWTGTGNILAHGLSSFRNFWEWEIRNNQSLVNVDGAADFSNETFGSLSKTGTGSNGTTEFGVSLRNEGNVVVENGTLSLTGTYTQSFGITSVRAGATLAATEPITIPAGSTLQGAGMVRGDVINRGVVRPRGDTDATGILTIQGNYTQDAGGTLQIDVLGRVAGSQYDRLAVTGTATLDGTLNVNRGGFQPPLGSRYEVLTCAVRAGEFARIHGLALETYHFVAYYNPTDLTLVVELERFRVTVPPIVTAGTPFTVTVTALDAQGNPNPNYVGTISFLSTDPLATLPGSYTFTAGDRGVHTFTNQTMFLTAGSQTLAVTDTSGALGLAAVLVNPIIVTTSGSAGTDLIVLRRQGGNPDRYEIQLNGAVVAAGWCVSLSAITLNGLAGDDTFTIERVCAGLSVTVNGGDGDDTFNVGSATSALDNIAGPLTLNGDLGRDTLNFNDQAAPAAQDLFLTSTTVRRATATVTYSLSEVLNVRSSTGGNTGFWVASTAAGMTVRLTGAGSDWLVLQTAGGTFRVTAWNAGTLTAAALGSPVTFSGVANLWGGPGDDAFVFADGQGIDGQLQGFGGTNTLDYSAYTIGVSVLLYVDYAQGTASVTDIANVIGGSGPDYLHGNGNNNLLVGNGGDDILLGDEGNDTLRGQDGRDQLYGGGGADRLEGGLGEDLLFDGYTNYDYDAAALTEIWLEWTRTDGTDYYTRIDNLRNGTGMSTYLLDLNNVFSDGDVDELIGEDELDWFWAIDGYDVLDRTDPDETLN